MLVVGWSFELLTYSSFSIFLSGSVCVLFFVVVFHVCGRYFLHPMVSDIIFSAWSSAILPSTVDSRCLSALAFLWYIGAWTVFSSRYCFCRFCSSCLTRLASCISRSISPWSGFVSFWILVLSWISFPTSCDILPWWNFMELWYSPIPTFCSTNVLCWVTFMLFTTSCCSSCTWRSWRLVSQILVSLVVVVVSRAASMRAVRVVQGFL